MRDYILEIARDLYIENKTVDIDEVAAIAGTNAAHVLEYFSSNAALNEDARHSARGLEGS